MLFLREVKLARRARSGMTLIEVMISLLICGVTIAGIVSGYTYCVKSSEATALSFAADAKAMQRIEETRSARWDTALFPSVDQVITSNFPPQMVTLDLSGDGQAATYATNYTEIIQVSTNPPLKQIRVQCVWNYRGKLRTNAVESARAPDA